MAESLELLFVTSVREITAMVKAGFDPPPDLIKVKKEKCILMANSKQRDEYLSRAIVQVLQAVSAKPAQKTTSVCYTLNSNLQAMLVIWSYGRWVDARLSHAWGLWLTTLKFNLP